MNNKNKILIAAVGGVVTGIAIMVLLNGKKAKAIVKAINDIVVDATKWAETEYKQAKDTISNLGAKPVHEQKSEEKL